MRCEIPHRCVRRKYRIRRHSPFRLRNCWEGRSVRASSLLRQLAKGGCAARRLSWVTPGFSQSRRCKTTASAKLACLQVDSRGSPTMTQACMHACRSTCIHHCGACLPVQVPSTREHRADLQISLSWSLVDSRGSSSTRVEFTGVPSSNS
ncbi:Uncharacterised protein [Chlamydia trachomatis]|nr:Uncharacterised protein [Chlamydia trachomatis]